TRIREAAPHRGQGRGPAGLNQLDDVGRARTLEVVELGSFGSKLGDEDVEVAYGRERLSRRPQSPAQAFRPGTIHERAADGPERPQTPDRGAVVVEVLRIDAQP